MKHSSRAMALGWTDYLCREDTLVPLRILGRYPVRVQGETVDIWAAFEHALRLNGYEDPTDFIGSYMCRTVAGSEYASNHAYGLSVDLDYGGDTDGDGDPTIDKNPHLHRPILPGDPAFGVEIQILEAQVRAVEAIKNTRGEQVLAWLGWVNGDSMHWDVNVRPDQCAVNWDTVKEWSDAVDYVKFRAAEFDMWSDQNIEDAFDRGRFEDSNRDGFLEYWTGPGREQRSIEEKARFMTDYYARL